MTFFGKNDIPPILEVEIVSIVIVIGFPNAYRLRGEKKTFFFLTCGCEVRLDAGKSPIRY